MPEIETVDHDETRQHLALVRALSGEVSNAISAIERNDMGELASHIAAQEIICHKLNQQDPQHLKHAFEAYRSTAQSREKSSLIQKVREAHLALARLNRTYAGVISRSQRSIELITNLYRNHGQGYNKDENVRPSKHTWSCEA